MDDHSLFFKEFRFINDHRLDVEQSSSQPNLVELTAFWHEMEPILVDMDRSNVNELIAALETVVDR